MKRIFDENYKIFIKTCNKCGCRFSYEVEDICGNWDHVYCPRCGKYLTTYVLKKMENIKIDFKEDFGK